MLPTLINIIIIILYFIDDFEQKRLESFNNESELRIKRQINLIEQEKIIHSLEVNVYERKIELLNLKIKNKKMKLNENQ